MPRSKPDPNAPARPDQPDAMVYKLTPATMAYYCTHCVTVREVDGRETGPAWRAATRHLWSRHGLRRTWVMERTPQHDDAVQMALPLLVGLNTTRHDRQG